VKGGEEIRDARKSDDNRKQWSTREREGERERDEVLGGPAGEE
jgi:hypothetical protein